MGIKLTLSHYVLKCFHWSADDWRGILPFTNCIYSISILRDKNSAKLIEWTTCFFYSLCFHSSESQSPFEYLPFKHEHSVCSVSISKSKHFTLLNVMRFVCLSFVLLILGYRKTSISWWIHCGLQRPSCQYFFSPLTDRRIGIICMFS